MSKQQQNQKKPIKKFAWLDENEIFTGRWIFDDAEAARDFGGANVGNVVEVLITPILPSPRRKAGKKK